MKEQAPYHWYHNKEQAPDHWHPNLMRLLLWLPLFCLLAGTMGCGNRKQLNEKITLWKNDKIPYGTWYAFEQLDKIFPNSSVRVNKTSPDKYNFQELENMSFDDEEVDSTKRSLYLIISPTVEPNNRELQAMFNYIGSGNHIFISAFEYSQNLLDSLRLKTRIRSGLNNMQDSLRISLIHPVEFDTNNFVYPGMQLSNHVTSFDSSITQVLGYSKSGKPNFLKFTYEGGGSLFLQFAPAAYTNFFLLHKNNKLYYDQSLSYVPANVDDVLWDDYFRYHRNGDSEQNNDFSAFSWMMKQPALAWTLWLLLLLFLLIYLFESKRKQRPIPVKAKLKNASVDFVKTIGRLYFQRKDNKNLGIKMTTHFLDQVRQNYNITTSNLDNNFETKLVYKTGCSSEEVKDLVYHIKMVQERPLVSDELLMGYHTRLEKFKNKFKDGR